MVGLTNGLVITTQLFSDCTAGKFGLNCDEICSEFCVNKTCNRTHGSCLNGCKDGYTGESCNKSKFLVCILPTDHFFPYLSSPFFVFLQSLKIYFHVKVSYYILFSVCLQYTFVIHILPHALSV